MYDGTLLAWVVASVFVLSCMELVMKKTLSTIFAASVLMSQMPVAFATLSNPGFESGLTGWTVAPGVNASVVTSHSGNDSTYGPIEGSYFLTIMAGSTDEWQTVTQLFTIQANQALHGWAAFDWRDYSPYLDGMRIRILDDNGAEVATPLYRDGSGQPNYWDGPWTQWSWTAPASGSYFLELGVRNTLDNALPSFGLFDAHRVPEPFSLALIGIGLAGLAVLRCRRYV